MSPLAISLRFLQTQPDQRLVELARAGHERAFEALVCRYRGALLAYCRRRAPRGTSPEDILQQGLLQAWKALSSGSEVRDARAWLYRIVHNVAISALRTNGEHPEGLLAGPGEPAVEQLVEQRMAAPEALEGLAALPDLQRRVMVSTALDGASHEETAAALGLSSGSVRGLIYRARSTLRAAAAALIPPPVIDWALGDAGGSSAGFAGAGGAGLGAVVLKGSTILAVGAVAGTAAIVAGPHSHGHHHRRAAAIGLEPEARQAAATASVRALSSTGIIGVTARANTSARVDSTAAALLGGGAGSRDGRSPSGRGPGDGGFQQVSGGGNGSRGGGGGGSRGGGDHGATTATSGSGGGEAGTTTTSTGTNGGSTSGSSDGGSTSGSSDGGTSTGSSGNTSTTTTSTTTSADR